MAIAITYSRASTGINAPIVTVETHISGGLPSLHIVGLPETVVKESKDRVRSAILNSNFEFPGRRITINLAPADLPKDGGRFDLPIALGILLASKQLTCSSLQEYEFAGELALSGELRRFQGVLSFALATKQAQRKLIIPEANANEASLAGDMLIFAAKHLLDVCAHLQAKQLLVPISKYRSKFTPKITHDLCHVYGQERAKRSLQIAAAGGHSLLFAGPPGTGKTLLSRCLPGILPVMTEKEAIEVAMINSLAGKSLTEESWLRRPFRNPHHTSSSNALVGGGNPPKPGEISLSHHGVLFLDELPEFKRHVLEALREPLESGSITVSRSGHQLQFPAKFQLVAAMNPCPCGYFGSKEHECTCSHEQIKRYQTKISGPLLDRIDLQVEVSPIPLANLCETTTKHETSAIIRERVEKVQDVQHRRQGKYNAALNNSEIMSYASLLPSHQQFMQQMMTRLKLSARSYYKILKIARTIADLEFVEKLDKKHLTEALSFRILDKLR